MNDIYYHNVSTDLTVEQFGVLTTNRLDALVSGGRKTNADIADGSGR